MKKDFAILPTGTANDTKFPAPKPPEVSASKSFNAKHGRPRFLLVFRSRLGGEKNIFRAWCLDLPGLGNIDPATVIFTSAFAKRAD